MSPVSFADDVGDYLARRGLGTVGEDIFSQVRPDEPDSCLVVADTGGAPPDPHVPLEDPTVQVLARAPSGAQALAALEGVRGAFAEEDGSPRTNFYLDEAGAIRVNIVQPLGLPGLLGLDVEGRALASVNLLFEIWRRR